MMTGALCISPDLNGDVIDILNACLTEIQSRRVQASQVKKALKESLGKWFED